jgi:hypothetical protein
MKTDFDIGNLVYVILTIVFLVFGLIGKKKKPLTRVSSEPQDSQEEPENLKTQFQELFREINPTVELFKEPEFTFAPKRTIEDGPSLDVVPEFSDETIEDIIPPVSQPIDSNINYNDQAQSSLDTTGMDEGVHAFDYGKDHSSLVYNDLTKEYSSILADDEEEMAVLVEEFDPKKAFLYSEIFKRKEF